MQDEIFDKILGKMILVEEENTYAGNVNIFWGTFEFFLMVSEDEESDHDNLILIAKSTIQWIEEKYKSILLNAAEEFYCEFDLNDDSLPMSEETFRANVRKVAHDIQIYRVDFYESGNFKIHVAHNSLYEDKTCSIEYDKNKKIFDIEI